MAAFDNDKDINTAEPLQKDDSEHSNQDEDSGFKLAWQIQRKEVQRMLGGDEDVDIDTCETHLSTPGQTNKGLPGVQNESLFSPFSSRLLNQESAASNTIQNETRTVNRDHSNGCHKNKTSVSTWRHGSLNNENKITVTDVYKDNQSHSAVEDERKVQYNNNRSTGEDESNVQHQSPCSNGEDVTYHQHNHHHSNSEDVRNIQSNYHHGNSEDERNIQSNNHHGNSEDERNIQSNNHHGNCEDERIAQQLMEQLRLEQVKEDEKYAQQLVESEKRHNVQTGNSGRRNVFHVPGRGPYSPRVVHSAREVQSEEGVLRFHPEHDLERPPSLMHVTPRPGLRQHDTGPHHPHHPYRNHLLHEYPRRPAGEHGASPMEELMRVPVRLAGLGNPGRFVGRERHPPVMNIVPNFRDLNDTDDYEALWDLGDRIGEVKDRGINKHDLSRLPTHVYKKDSSKDMTSSSSESKCLICLTGFSEGDNVKTLPCLHMYHSTCIDKWLKKNAICPICRESIKIHNAGRK